MFLVGVYTTKCDNLKHCNCERNRNLDGVGVSGFNVHETSCAFINMRFE
jgi:hypothetical protein